MVLLCWTVVWVLKLYLDDSYPMLADSAVSFSYWTVVKLIVWILPSVWIIKRTGRTVREVFRVKNVKKMLGWGVSLGGLLAGVNIAAHLIGYKALTNIHISFALINVVIIAPVFEEFTLRGAVFGALRQQYSFLMANTITAALFVMLHVPGWFFTQRVATSMLTPLGGVLAVFVIGWLCGLAAERGKSVFASMIVHFLNNITA